MTRALVLSICLLLAGCQEDDVKLKCYRDGYPQVKAVVASPGKFAWFCVRRINGTDEMKEVRQ